MRGLLRVVVMAGLVAIVAGAAAGNAAASQLGQTTGNGIRLTLLAPPQSGVLAGQLDFVPANTAYVVVTVTLLDGTSRAVTVNASTNWQFSFGVLPTDGWVGLSITEVPIPMPVLTNNQWDYRYYYGYYYAYPDASYVWSQFPGYSWPAGYGWGYYPYGYYAYANYLYSQYGMPYYWTYPPISTTPTYSYWAIGGVPTTYLAPSYTYTAFGTIYQPYITWNPYVGSPYAYWTAYGYDFQTQPYYLLSATPASWTAPTQTVATVDQSAAINAVTPTKTQPVKVIQDTTTTGQTTVPVIGTTGTTVLPNGQTAASNTTTNSTVVPAKNVAPARVIASDAQTGSAGGNTGTTILPNGQPLSGQLNRNPVNSTLSNVTPPPAAPANIGITNNAAGSNTQPLLGKGGGAGLPVVVAGNTSSGPETTPGSKLPIYQQTNPQLSPVADKSVNR